MDKEKERQIREKINKALESVDKANPLPEKLSAAGISEMLKEKQAAGEVTALKLVSTEAKRRKIAKRIVASVAALAILVGTGGVLAKLYDNSRTYIDENWQTTPPLNEDFEGNPLPDNLKNPKSYQQLEKMFLNMRNDRNKVSIPGIAQGWGGLGEMENALDSDSMDLEAGFDDNAGSHGKTNVQVQGVDEADIIKNDGTYLYIKHTGYDMAQNEGERERQEPDITPAAPPTAEPTVDPEQGQTYPPYEGEGNIGYDVGIDDVGAGYPDYYYKGIPYYGIRIVKAYPATEMEEVAMIKITESGAGEGLDEFSLSNIYINEFYLKDNKLYVIVSENFHRNVGMYSEDKNITSVLIYDVSDKSSPKFEKSFSQDGSYLSSRIAEDRLVVMTNHQVMLYGNRVAMASSAVPGIYNDGAESKLAVDSILLIDGVQSTNYLVLSNINIADLDEAPVYKSILGGGSDSYCTSDTLYVSNVVYDYNRTFAEGDFEIAADIMIAPASSYTEVFSFDIRGGIAFKNSGKVPGNPLNQFAMDEYKGYFRIATTSINKNRDMVNNVFVMDKDFKIVGSVEDLAKGESIQSVRFMGDTAYVVTFFRTDPLFVIDMSRPEKPEVLGELKIPGFSQYLHPVGEGLILGVGVSGDDEGQTDGIKASLFDVSNPRNPLEIDKLEKPQSNIINTSHKAFFSVPNESLYGVVINSYGFNERVGYYDYESGLYTFKVVGKSLELHHLFVPQSEKNPYYSGGLDVTRGTYINDIVYFNNYDVLTAFSMETGEQIAVLKAY